MQYDKHKNAKKIFLEIDKSPQNYLIIHYSCENFYDIKDGHTPRVTSIAVYSLDSMQTDSFSIHKLAEKQAIHFDNIEENYNHLERHMLDEFYQFVNEHKNYKWIHWHMRDINYGFQAIDLRYEILGGTPTHIPNTSKVDLGELLIQFFGENYMDHPRMENLIKLNKISDKDYLAGKDEAHAFNNKEYIKLHRSTIRKVHIFYNIINRVLNKSLFVQSKWKEMYGVSIQGCYEAVSGKWWWAIILMVLGALISQIPSLIFY